MISFIYVFALDGFRNDSDTLRFLHIDHKISIKEFEK